MAPYISSSASAWIIGITVVCFVILQAVALVMHETLPEMFYFIIYSTIIGLGGIEAGKKMEQFEGGGEQ
ncbi:hypothetical protein HYX07_00285 [Candidatus Woesearchaeota archaeon]|nr:hypothetical protein [Candidatus Woesearchaeota archaeon]